MQIRIRVDRSPFELLALPVGWRKEGSRERQRVARQYISSAMIDVEATQQAYAAVQLPVKALDYAVEVSYCRGIDC